MRTNLRLAFLLFLHASCTWGTARSQDFEFTPISKEVIETRLLASSDKDARRFDTLLRLFEEAGCDANHITQQPVNGARLPNLICTLPGNDESVIIVGAHYDHASRGKGVVDNWSGTALLPSLFQSLGQAHRQHTLVFIGFTEEEQGLIGSKHYVKHLSEEQKGRILAMVNLDSIGLSYTKIWVSHADPKLVQSLSFVASSLDLQIAGVNAERIGSADSEPFFGAKIPCITIHSVTQATLSILHSARDNAKAIRISDYYDTYHLIAAYLAYLDKTLSNDE